MQVEIWLPTILTSALEGDVASFKLRPLQRHGPGTHSIGHLSSVHQDAVEPDQDISVAVLRRFPARILHPVEAQVLCKRSYRWNRVM